MVPPRRVGLLPLLTDDREDGVGPRRHLAHAGGARGPHLRPHVHEAVDLLRRPHNPLAEPLHVHPLVPVLADHELRGGVGLDEVGDDLVVDLEVRRAHQEPRAGVAAVLDVVEDLLRRAGDDPAVAVAREALHNACDRP